ncbi:MAG: hypothetical protein JWN69_1058 [Alphaproteobacteria bacterium]|nr:hypothetical protein [Alphaproteobacteria bacterium]
MAPTPDLWDCIIVGAGPGGLSAALYMARFKRRILVIHDARARALRIPKTHNAPGFDEGVSGRELIDRMMRHAVLYGALVEEEHVSSAEASNGMFVLRSAEGREWQARTLIVATGIELNQITLPDDVHEAAIHANVLRYCPVCDAFEHAGKRIGVVGCDSQGAAEALFLARYSDDITLLPRCFTELTETERADLAAANINLCEAPVVRYEPQKDMMCVYVEGRTDPIKLDVLYPALGTSPRTQLAQQLGVALNASSCVPADAMLETNVPGLWCAGDILEGLDQISVAMGHGAVAATKAHNWLRELDRHVVGDRAAS